MWVIDQAERSRWLDFGQVILLRVYGPRKGQRIHNFHVADAGLNISV